MSLEAGKPGSCRYSGGRPMALFRTRMLEKSEEASKLLQAAMADENRTVREAAAKCLTELAWMHD